MVSNSAPKKVEQKKTTVTAARSSIPETSPSVKGVPAKSAPKRPNKPLNKSKSKTSPVAAINPATKAVTKVPRKAAVKGVSKPLSEKNTVKNIKSEKNVKPKRIKMVRDSFTMPELEYELIAAMKRRCVANGLAVKKSDVLRAAIIGFAALSDSAAIEVLKALPVIKTGRPAKVHK